MPFAGRMSVVAPSPRSHASGHDLRGPLPLCHRHHAGLRARSAAPGLAGVHLVRLGHPSAPRGARADARRGMALVGAVADRWGVQLDADGKVTRCELATGLPPVSGHDGCLRMTQVETVIGLYGDHGAGSGSRTGRLGVTEGEEAAISVITDLLHWLSAHGRDGDDVLDRAQVRFEAEVSEGSW
ncbi:hypothetical protein SAMN05428941_3050 [Streptomyces sp. 2114.2]|nr:hypothetical protein SAMN05428941_3050 [Streptomyces sp. 2114.2]